MCFATTTLLSEAAQISSMRARCKHRYFPFAGITWFWSPSSAFFTSIILRSLIRCVRYYNFLNKRCGKRAHLITKTPFLFCSDLYSFLLFSSWFLGMFCKYFSFQDQDKCVDNYSYMRKIIDLFQTYIITPSQVLYRTENILQILTRFSDIPHQ